MLRLLSDLASEKNNLLNLSLDEFARVGARKLLLQALQFEVDEYIEKYKDDVDEQSGRCLVVKNGKGRPRKVTTGARTVEVQAPRVNDKRGGCHFRSLILPLYIRKSGNVESILPILNLKGLSGNSFQKALCGLLGDQATGLSATSISSLKKAWRVDLDKWRKKADYREICLLLGRWRQCQNSTW